MAAEWMFDAGAVASELGEFAEQAEEALDAARGALERADEDALSERDRRALARALRSVSGTRGRLQALDAELLADAERLLREVLERAERPPIELIAQQA